MSKLRVFATITILIVVAAACGQKDHAEPQDTYICPMHPTVVSDKPATCPVCGMDLVRKARPGEEVAITDDLAKLIKSPNEAVVGNIATTKGQYKPLVPTLDAQGIVTYDTRNLFTISSRIGGRLENVYLKYNFQPVSKGQKIAEIYSPELIAAQREFLFLIENDPSNTTLADAAKKKLELLGMTSQQISKLSERRQAENIFPIFSDYNGYLISTTATSPPTMTTTTASANTGMSGGMSVSSPPAQNSTNAVGDSNLLREGNYVATGETLFQVVTNDALRVEMDIPAKKTGAIKKGDKLQLDFGNAHIEQAPVDFVQPYFNEGDEFLKVRVIVKNAPDLHIGHLVTAHVQLPALEALWIPKEAVVDLGDEKIVFVKERSVFKPKKIQTGISTDGMLQVIVGLASSDEFAANAQYLVDSESFIKSIK